MKHLGLFLSCMMLLNCGCIRNKTTNATKNITSLEALLPENTIKIIKATTKISFFKVEQHLIAGTENEYSNKSIFQRDLTEQEVTQFLKLVYQDNSYNWQNYTETVPNFLPTKQFVLKNGNEQVNVLLDLKKQMLSVINLDGQHIIPITNKLQNFLIKF